MRTTIRKSQRAFLAVTVLTVIAVTTVFMVYAAILATYTGNTVTVNAGTGSIQYTLDGFTWLSSLPSINNGTAWYARISMTGAAAQAVTIPWTLQRYNSTTTSWDDKGTPVTTSMTLSVGPNTIYATTSGSSGGNTNWGALVITGGDYRVRAVVNG